ncbi:MAG: hypothetical protein ACTHN5_06085 [Phycisphaerae bacterium]
MINFLRGGGRFGRRKTAFLIAPAEDDQVRFAGFSEDYQVADLAAAFLIASAEDDQVVVGEREGFWGGFWRKVIKVGVVVEMALRCE